MSDNKLSFTQRVVLMCMPRSWHDSVEKESRQWKVICPCGHARSVWEMGGVRWKATGKPSWRRTCPQCKQFTWHNVAQDKS